MFALSIIWLDHVYCNTIIHLSQRIIVILFTWIEPSVVIHPRWMVYWISIVVIHIFIILKPKRCKVNNDSATYLWHCRLGHIGVKRMKKLHADGLFESLDACEPCLMGNMTKDSVLRNNGVSNWLIGNNTYWCMQSDECYGSRRVSLFFWPSQMIWADMGISTWWNISLKHLKSSKNSEWSGKSSWQEK